ncbi:MAG: hypothetical protein IPP49_17010 [Saprospiraceae bacterium]|nr:hypothetical protein [Saprospiraceae bacterium]
MKNSKHLNYLTNLIFWSFLLFDISSPSNVNAQISNYWGCGSSFVTCGPGVFDLQDTTFRDGVVCGIIDVRQTLIFSNLLPTFTEFMLLKCIPTQYGLAF